VISLRATALALILTGCSPAPLPESAPVVALDERLAALERQETAASGPLALYTFVMSEDAPTVALADAGELPLLVSISEVRPHGDSQTVSLHVTNPHSVQLRSVKFVAIWRIGDGAEREREVEWSGETEPGVRMEVSFTIGPIASEDLGSITISRVRSRWAVRVPRR
jgi:hypothetical protein